MQQKQKTEAADVFIYRLKGMVLVRLLAEVAGLILLFVLPGILLAHGDFMRISMITRVIVCTLSLLALLILPYYSALPFKVKLDSEGITTYSLFSSQQAEWLLMSSLKLRTTWGWRRYIVTTSGGTLIIPIWLNDLPALVSRIRERLPNRGHGEVSHAERLFKQDAVNLVVQSTKSIASLVFLGIFWTFAFSLRGATVAARKADPMDFAIVIAGGLILSGLILIRFVLTASMPLVIHMNSEGLKMQSLFSRRELLWRNLKRVSNPWFFLPEGLVIQTTTGSLFMIGDQLDSFDELQEELLKKSSENATVNSPESKS